MARLCVERDKAEIIVKYDAIRDDEFGVWQATDENNCFDDNCRIELPDGTIKKLIGKKLTWNDEPFKFCENTESRF